MYIYSNEENKLVTAFYAVLWENKSKQWLSVS